MSFYDFTVEEYAEFLKKELAGTDIVPMGIMTPGKRGRKPKQLEQTPASTKTTETAISTTRMEQAAPNPIYVEVDDAREDDPSECESQQLTIYDNAYIDFSPRENPALQYDAEARLLGHFCTLVIRRLEDCESRVEEWKQIVIDYNNGNLVPELFKLRGERKERALRCWIDLYIQTERDMYALLHGNKNSTRKRKISEIEGKILLSILLHPNKVTIGSAITMLKAQARMGQYESPSCKPTLRRWCEDWRNDNLAIWEQTRKGSKFVAEHIIKTIHRDSRLLKVGQVWVADGHTLAFDILNPKTGKAQRMTMIMVMDWASRYPVGASLAFTEDSHHIQVAFRNGFLNWGALPQCVYLDNGKSFRSKLFHEEWDHHDLELELGGIFPKLGIEAHFAESYNAKAKIIERFFKTFQEQFERFISSFRGASIADKPATLMRNEKWVKKLYEGEPPTIEETMRMIGYYVRYIYGDNPHGGLNGKTPWQVFSSAPLPEGRIVQPDKLNFMMLATERKSVRNDGIVFNKLQYWHPELIKHIGKPIVFRYDYADARWILVYDTRDKFICQAELRRSQHPFVHLDKDNPISHKELNTEYKYIKKLQRMNEQQSKLFVKKNQESVDRILKPMLEARQANPTFIQPPMIEAPKPGPEEEIARLEEIVTSQSQPTAIEPDIKPIINQSYKKADTASGQDQQFNPFEDESFTEMLKTIGIK